MKLSKLTPILALPLLTSCGMQKKSEQEAVKPNVIFFLMDDLGWKDLEIYGAELYETPNIDKLCRAGTRFTNAYTSAAICAPARATALTGYHPVKLGMWNHHHHMPDNPVTLPSLLKESGYATWHVGKWHCGSPENNTMPEGVGFDVNIAGGQSWGPASFFWPYENKRMNERNFVPHMKELGKEGDYLTDALTDQAVKLIKNRDPEKPFFLNMWHYAVHGPWQGKPELVEKYKQKIKDLGLQPTEGRLDPATGTRLVTSYTGNIIPIYAAMIQSMDESVGRIIDALKEEGLYENTLIVFYSDNGSVTHHVPCVPLMGGKNSTYEAGIRVPAFFTWEGKIPSGITTDDQITIADVPFTILDMALNKSFPTAEDERDGVSIAKIFKGEKLENRKFFWYFPDTRLHWAQRANAAIMDEDGFKYIMYFNGDKDELYNIKTDYIESKNIIANHPAKVAELNERLKSTLAKYYNRMPPPPNEYKELTEKRLGVN